VSACFDEDERHRALVACDPDAQRFSSASQEVVPMGRRVKPRRARQAITTYFGAQSGRDHCGEACQFVSPGLSVSETREQHCRAGREVPDFASLNPGYVS
jgi:hypothetical protein